MMRIASLLRTRSLGAALVGLCVAALTIVSWRQEPHPPDEAKAEGYSAADFPEVAADLFQPMDGGIALSADEIKGRNSWLLWTAGNQAFWDQVARTGYGVVDLLKTLDSRRRPHRFAEMGLINEPGFKPAAAPDEFGLWLDQPTGPTMPVDARVYGRSSGIIGFRLFPNPAFDERAKERWNPDRYYNDAAYYTDPGLVRPYRVGVTCGVCHVGPNPLRPPADPENPDWSNLSSVIGNQYLREGKVFTLEQPGSFFWEMLNAQPPGTSDTSRAATDHINNPGAINAMLLLGPRLAEAAEETIAGGALAFPGGEQRPVPHLLKDGADSVGVAGAMLRVYVNEGLYSNEWLSDHELLLGLRAQKPFPVQAAFDNSVYWQATYARLDNIAKFFLRMGPMHLEDAPGGDAFLSKDPAVMDRGKIVFAENCAACHSSKQPPADIPPRSDQARAWYRASVMRPDFRDGNFLSTDKRYPLSLIKTNACRALATNAMRGQIWDNFSSETYKTLKSVGTIDVYDPTDEARPYRLEMPAGGPGYYRPPSLAAIWASAPFLHNNSVGIFTGDSSVAGRMRAFDDAIDKLLWPEKRLGKESVGRTTQASYLRIPAAFVPVVLRPLVRDDVLSIGPIPEGMPINLLANVDPTAKNIVTLAAAANEALLQMAAKKLSFDGAGGGDAVKTLTSLLLSASKCPDLIEDHGHEFGTQLPDADKRALIEFLKTL